jgi:hypothetical protein
MEKLGEKNTCQSVQNLEADFCNENSGRLLIFYPEDGGSKFL